jgi:uracil-DNA glycosylase
VAGVWVLPWHNHNAIGRQDQIEESWREVLQDEFDKAYFEQLVHFIKTEKQEGKIIYPEGKHIFNAFNQTSFEDIHVVILGQDPYHAVNQAHGLSFSVPDGIKIPPSLKKIFKELRSDIGKEIPKSGNLIHWAKQGILLLNASLTVEENKPMSHSKIGWNLFTDAVIKKISQEKTNVIFILWGKFAQEKEKLIDPEKHFILKAAHPSPLSAYNGFWGCRHFSKTNELLKSIKKEEIKF